MKTYVRTNYVPERYIKAFTKGKWYEVDVRDVGRGHTYGHITADNGVGHFIRVEGSYHLDEKDWDVVRSNTHPDSLELSKLREAADRCLGVNRDKISKEKALECLEDLDDFARMETGVAPTGQYETLKKFIEQS